LDRRGLVGHALGTTLDNNRPVQDLELLAGWV